MGIQKKVLVKFHFLFLHSVLSRGGGGGGGGGVLGGGPRENSMSISNPNLELWPKN